MGQVEMGLLAKCMICPEPFKWLAQLLLNVELYPKWSYPWSLRRVSWRGSWPLIYVCPMLCYLYLQLEKVVWNLFLVLAVVINDVPLALECVQCIQLIDSGCCRWQNCPRGPVGHTGVIDQVERSIQKLKGKATRLSKGWLMVYEIYPADLV